jgi:hypothetical protein
VTLPTFFIIGAAKAGTTSLHSYLDQHPEIQMSAVKEPNFFSGPPNGIPYPTGRVKSLEQYEALFDPGAPVRGEASVGYSNHPRRKGVAANIEALVPDARFVYLVRDPIARVVSQHRHRVAWEGERRALSEALGDLTDPLSPYLGPSRYMTQIELYLRHFPAERMLVVDQADLLADRRATLRQTFAFLGVDPDIDSTRFDEELNTESVHRAFPVFYSRLLGRDSLPPLAQSIPRPLRRSLRRALERALWSPVEQAPLADPLRERLAELFGEEVRRLRAFAGNAFASWSI